MIKTTLQKTTYWLEIIAFPFFVYLVFNFASSGSEAMLNSFDASKNMVTLFPSLSIVIGIAILIFFMWIWNRPAFKKLTPCAHDTGDERSKYFHALAIAAFSLHFFLEALIRAELLKDFSLNSILSVSALIGFMIHFIIDLLSAVMLSFYWKSITAKIVSFCIMVSAWISAFFFEKMFYSAHDTFNFLPPSIEGLAFIAIGFFLAMFVHIPPQILTLKKSLKI